MADKDVDGVIAALAGVDGHARRPRHRDRRRPAARAAGRRARRALAATRDPADRAPTVAADPGAALDRALAGPGGPVVVAGSLYLVGAVRARLVDDPLLRDPIDEAR